MILDLHLHSERSDDSRAPVEQYLKILQRKRAERPLDGIVLTEHRQFDLRRDFRDLEDRYGLLILNAAEVETDYGHVLVYGVNADMLARFDFADVRLSYREHSEAIADQLPEAELVLVPDAGHLVMLEHPEVVTDRLADLLTRAGAVPAGATVSGYGSTSSTARRG